MKLSPPLSPCYVLFAVQHPIDRLPTLDSYTSRKHHRYHRGTDYRSASSHLCGY